MSHKIRRFLKEAFNPHLRIHRREHRRWLDDKGESLRRDFPTLGPQSTVFDIGGYAGGWTDAIHSRYGCTIHVFEPHPTFAAELMEKYSGYANIHVHAFALGSECGILRLSDAGDASSALSGVSGSLIGEVVAVSKFMADFQPRSIDLAKINIEGGEYDLLPALVRADQLGRFALLQIQFHMFNKGHIIEREAIHDQLSKSHHCDWSYDFVWEQWSRKDPAT